MLGEGFFKSSECFLRPSVPLEPSFFSSQIGQWESYLRIVLNESPVEVAESQKSLDFFDLLRSGPLSNSLDSTTIHRYPLGVDDET